MLDARGIFADEQRGDVLNSSDDGARVPFQGGLSPAVQALLISEDLDEILDLSDRIAVMYRGRVAGVVDRDEAEVDRIGLMMSGVAT